MDSAGNIYRHKVDFAALALQDPAFKEFLSAKGQLDFSNPDAVRQLTVSLLRRDFGLDVELPDDRLCPPVNDCSLNYILWLQDLIACTGDDYGEKLDAERDVVGLDIGTGSSCIYPLLGTVHRKRWTFVATDIDEKNLQHARENVRRNHLQSRIQVVDSTPDGPLIPLDRIQRKMLDFTMCNPPFYESHEEMLQLAEEKEHEPLSVCTGAEMEMITPGGEVAFVKKMIQESLRLQEAVRWYTSMLGKRSSLLSLIDELQRLDNKNWAVTEFIQGDKTKRWAIAWSWKDIRPTMGVARSISNVPKKHLPFPSEFHFSLPCKSVDSLIEVINAEIKSFRIPWNWDTQRSSGLGFTMENAWSRHARRKRQQQEAAQDGPGEAEALFDTENAVFGFIIQVRRPGLETADVTVRWVKGVDSVIFESFCGMLKRKVGGR
ncbi:DUF890 domain-containing protein [Nannizzia gypsea CBS 118893]|uniref:U6 small nuclear RNA (adenine-(43)-N(6))-methyltransferase n=1 Tax=Arthroderma gypseum (strain ATCC MYA-4604 / CBS 118893) TaxID=535722 RepID=E4UN66_ARTGP|nr:DUF890 domain-containing protein [Nannizzia gypsea CBS 118893]EFQ99527.1 DUF890 domain-containing protein [Nannizzia gypsea CBS 118893]